MSDSRAKLTNSNCVLLRILASYEAKIEIEKIEKNFRTFRPVIQLIPKYFFMIVQYKDEGKYFICIRYDFSMATLP